MSRPVSTAPKQSGFPKGTSGNPAGRPKGARNKSSLALDALGAANAEAVLSAVVNQALAGDTSAAKIILDRIWPSPKARGVALDIPAMNEASDAPKALAAIVAAMAKGDLAPAEAQAMVAVVVAAGRALAGESEISEVTGMGVSGLMKAAQEYMGKKALAGN